MLSLESIKEMLLVPLVHVGSFILVTRCVLNVLGGHVMPNKNLGPSFLPDVATDNPSRENFIFSLFSYYT